LIILCTSFILPVLISSLYYSRVSRGRRCIFKNETFEPDEALSSAPDPPENFDWEKAQAGLQDILNCLKNSRSELAEEVVFYTLDALDLVDPPKGSQRGELEEVISYLNKITSKINDLLASTDTRENQAASIIQQLST
jgi:hypothetical protein